MNTIKDKRVRTWNMEGCIFEIPDDIIMKILKSGLTHTYSINADLKSFTIQEVPCHGGGRNCWVIYSSGKVVHIPKNNFKRGNKKKKFIDSDSYGGI